MDYRISLKEMAEKGKVILLKLPKPTREKILRQVKELKEMSIAKNKKIRTDFTKE